VSNQVEAKRMGRLVKVLLAANLCLWIYFWIAFAHSSYPYRPNPLGHPAGTGFTFWGHSIAVVEDGLSYPFFRVVYWIEFPTFTLAITLARLFYHPLLFYGFFAGISRGGWFLLTVMVLSFFQWYLIGWVAQKLWQRWFGNTAAEANRATST
jgi:hypothetical protein